MPPTPNPDDLGSGVSISGTTGPVAGDIVGRDKITFAFEIDGRAREKPDLPEVAHRRSLGVIWSVLSMILLIYYLTAWILTQSVFPRVQVATFSIPICATLLAGTSALGMRLAKLGNGMWFDRLPILGSVSINRRTPEGKAYLSNKLILVSVLPVLSQVHFWNVFSQGYVVTTGYSPRLLTSVWNWASLSFNDPARICTRVYSSGSGLECIGGVTVLPGLEPTLFAALSIVSIVLVGGHWRFLFREAPLR